MGCSVPAWLTCVHAHLIKRSKTVINIPKQSQNAKTLDTNGQKVVPSNCKWSKQYRKYKKKSPKESAAESKESIFIEIWH